MAATAHLRDVNPAEVLQEASALIDQEAAQRRMQGDDPAQVQAELYNEDTVIALLQELVDKQAAHAAHLEMLTSTRTGLGPYNGSWIRPAE